jgi:signal transduction histidine kinase
MEKRMEGNDLASRAGAGGQASHLVSLTTLSPELLSPFFHEFRTSLTMIKTCIALLTNPHVTYDRTELREFMDIVRRGGDRVDRLVRDFLAILKLESGVAVKEACEAEPTEDVAGAISAVVRSLQHDIAEHNVTVQVDVPDELPPLPVSDEHLQMIVEKLLHNAVKFTKPEGGRVQVRVIPEGSVVRFEVADQGVGIPEDEQERIFDGFQQITQAGLERQGAGLGLAVARGLVELYGGRISVRSRVDAGSTFVFVLPVQRVSVVAPEPAAPAPVAQPPAGGEAPLTAEEAFRRLGITFEEKTEPGEPEGPSQGLGRRKK